MNRIINTLDKIAAEGRKFLIAYLTGGVPDINGTIEYFRAIEEGGADIIEIGIPFSDALADGPVNQKAALEAIKNGIGINDMFNLMSGIRSFSETPVIFLVYYNTVFHYGPGRFVADCLKYGVDGLVIPDLPLEERQELQSFMDKAGLCLIPLVAPNSGERIKTVTNGCSGFVYCVSSMGVTGERKNFRKDINGYIQNVRMNCKLPAAVGFGISDSSTAGVFYDIADGIIVGSAIVRRILKGCSQSEITEFISELVYKR